MTFFWLFVLLQVLDVATTWYALEKTTGLAEGNQFMLKLMDRLGVLSGLILPKIVILGAVWLLNPLEWGMIALCVFYIVVVINNVIKIKDAAN